MTSRPRLSDLELFDLIGTHRRIDLLDLQSTSSTTTSYIVVAGCDLEEVCMPNFLVGSNFSCFSMLPIWDQYNLLARKIG